MSYQIFLGCVSLLLSTVAHATELPLCVTESGEASAQTLERRPLPERDGTRVRTSGRVPHVQIGVEPVTEVNRELYRLAFSLPEVEKRPTIVSLPGTDGMWLNETLPVVKPRAIVAGREFAHIHVDGSLHAPLPYTRAIEIAEKGWGERHPWADKRGGWEGFVMIFTPQSLEELEVVFQIILESYNYVTGKSLHLSAC